MCVTQFPAKIGQWGGMPMHCRLGMFGKPKQKREREREGEEAEEGEVEQASWQDLASFACETKKGVNPNPRISQMARNHAIADAASEACCGGKSNAAAPVAAAPQMQMQLQLQRVNSDASLIDGNWTMTTRTATMEMTVPTMTTMTKCQRPRPLGVPIYSQFDFKLRQTNGNWTVEA